jgi:putative phosphoribosyl transferase
MIVAPLFRDRTEAGEALGHRLKAMRIDSTALVLSLPRGGVPVGFEVARTLGTELDVFLVRKLGLPGREELAIGAIASGGIRVLNHGLIAELGLSTTMIDHITARERLEIERRERLYREGRAGLAIRQRTVILVDDGLATGASMLAAAHAVRTEQPERIVAGVPVAAPEACRGFRRHVDEIVCLHTPEPFYSVGAWYQDFSQISDAEVRMLLERALNQPPQVGSRSPE